MKLSFDAAPEGPDGSAVIGSRSAGDGTAMRKRYRVLLFAALVAGFMAPVGYALSIESAPWIGQAFHPASAPSALQGFDAAGLLLVGTGLFGLAAVIRKSI